MSPRSPIAAALLIACAAVIAPTHADTSHVTKRGERPDHDVRVKLRVRGKRKARLRVDVKVKNRGRATESDLELVLHTGDPSEPVWTQGLSLRSGKRARFRFKIDRDDVSEELIAECRGVEDDDEPEDNEDRVDVAPRPVSPSAAERGRDLYVPLCSGCHGADGRGGSVRDDDDDDDDRDDDDDDDRDDDISRESWDEFLEAFREGEDGMPRYPQLGARDARDIVAYLRNPGAVAPPEPVDPVDPPPTGTVPTYSAHVKPLLDAECVSCHGGGFAAAGIALHTYADASGNAAASLASVEAGRMPTSGPWSAAQIATLRDWIEGGRPE